MRKIYSLMLLCAAMVFVTGCSKDDDNNTTSVTGVTLSETTLTLEVNGTKTLIATVAPDNATDKTVTWSSSKTDVATVDENGKVEGKAAGETTITVTTKEGGKTATCKVTVTGVSSLKIGDYYPIGATKETAKGVVFWVDPDNSAAGKAVSLDEGVDIQWCTEDLFVTTCSSFTDGLVNTNIVKSLADYSETKYPAVAWCLKKGEGWYLPAQAELTDDLYGAFKADKTAFNKKLTDAGGTALSDEYYWSSTNGKLHVPANPTTGSFHEGQPTTSKNRVRAVHAF